MRIVRLLAIAETSFLSPVSVAETGHFLCRSPQACACERDWNKPAKAGRTSAKITAHNTATKRANGSPLGAIKAWKTRILTITGASMGHRQRHVTVDQQKYRCDDL